MKRKKKRGLEEEGPRKHGVSKGSSALKVRK